MSYPKKYIWFFFKPRVLLWTFLARIWSLVPACLLFWADAIKWPPAGSFSFRLENSSGGAQRLFRRDEQPQHQTDPWRRPISAEGHHAVGLRTGSQSPPFAISFFHRSSELILPLCLYGNSTRWWKKPFWSGLTCWKLPLICLLHYPSCSLFISECQLAWYILCKQAQPHHVVISKMVAASVLLGRY